MIEEFKTILYNKQEDKFLPFMQTLKAKDKKELAAFLMQEAKRDDWDTIRKQQVTSLFALSCYICCTYNQMRTMQWNTYKLILEYSDFNESVLRTLAPNRMLEYQKYIVEKKQSFPHLSYRSYIQWIEKGYLAHDKYLCASLLSGSLCQYDSRTNTSTIDVDVLFFRKVVLDEHIWYLFQSGNYMIDTYYDSKSCTLPQAVYDMFNTLVREKKIEYEKLVSAIADTVHYTDFFMNADYSWFADLLSSLPIEHKGSLAVQQKLFPVLRAKNTKIVSATLNVIKEIVTDKQFDKESFVAVLGELLGSKTKKTVIGTLDIITKALAADSKTNQCYVTELGIGFIQTDKTIQLRIAGLIVQYGKTNDEVLRANLQQYITLMLVDTKEALKDFLTDVEEESIIEEYVESSVAIYSQENKLQWAETEDDVVFLMSSVFDTYAELNIEKVIDATLRFKTPETDLELDQVQNYLYSACKKALKEPFGLCYTYGTDNYEKTMFFWLFGGLVQLTAIYYVDYIVHLIDTKGEKVKPLKEAYDAIWEQINNNKSKYLGFWGKKEFQLVPLVDWRLKDIQIFQPYHHWCLYAKELVQHKFKLPMLAMPTHEPIWIEPSVLVSRLRQYQESKVVPNLVDLLFALCRCHPDTRVELLECGKKELAKFYYGLIDAFYGEGQLTTAGALNNTTIEAYIQRYVFKTSEEKLEDRDFTKRHRIEMELHQSPWKGQINPFSEADTQVNKYISIADIRPYIRTFGAYIELPFAQIVKDVFWSSNVALADVRDYLVEAIKSLYDTKVKIQTSTAMFLACSMFSSEGSLRDYGVEIWIERVSYDLIDIEQFGTYAGMLANKEWGAVKRFNTLVSEKMLNISTKHNQALEETLIYLLLQIEGNVTGLKVTLELYSEILALNKNKTSQEVLTKLNNLSTISTLKKTIKQLQTQ
ncbi:DUF6493 family protein [Myroides marinus]|uniref:DUF6493 family protein n=1 Tax=Myroides marinus TaxID=703342 RepID=UPI0025750268|nr:DUF6493 family protein [Myroides marinus]MDM1379565.1 hypothetical protein [Myroides marinus]MDM1386836.1 hypothetical protein [Myroides marinus]MDM1394049.1 hypothetical protein [Myroides marinus]